MYASLYTITTADNERRLKHLDHIPYFVILLNKAQTCVLFTRSHQHSSGRPWSCLLRRKDHRFPSQKNSFVFIVNRFLLLYFI